MARWLGARQVRYDRLVAVVAEHVPRKPGDVDSVTTVESVIDGWWYTARIPNAHRIFVFHTDGDLLDVRAARDADSWMRRLASTTHMENLLSRFDYQLVDAPVVVSAASLQLSVAAGQDWLAAGDAALASDPLAGQGILMAINSGRIAAESIIAYEAGDNDALPRFQAWVDALGREYLDRRRHYYDLEQRWPTSPFWCRRHSTKSPR
jgi:flavin-dependent dehydrogenase